MKNKLKKDASGERRIKKTQELKTKHKGLENANRI
jgi:hypothetical protein